MHIPDGVLSLPVLVTGGALAAGGLVMGIRRLDDDRLPRTALLSAGFFIASLVSVPVGPTSVHLVLAGLMGLVLGWTIFPAVFVSLVLQALVFGFGGLASLGVNTLNIALPGLFWAWALRPWLLRAATPAHIGLVAGLVALMTTLTGALCVILSLGLSDPHYFATAPFIALTYLPLAVGEIAITVSATLFLTRVRPETLGLPMLAAENG